MLWTITLLCLTTTQLVYGFNLTILHTNDIHSRIEEMNKYNGRCSSSSAAEGQCYGGVERLKSKIDEMRRKYPDNLLLDAGDWYQGTLFFSVYGGQLLSEFMNSLGYDAMALGNHEFDRGTSGLVPFVDNAAFNIISSNINTSHAPQLSAVQKSVEINVNGESIGIIGYTTTATAIISRPEKVIFHDEIESIQEEVNVLTGRGVNKIIAVGHAGYNVDMKIAEKVRGVDVVIGGHSNTFLYTGDSPPDHEKAMGAYPTIVRNVEGKGVLVVQDYAFGKYLGFLQVEFDKSGVVTGWNGNPILLDNTVEKDKNMTSMIQKYLPKVQKMLSEKIGVSLVHLDGNRHVCRVRECNMGNLIADAMVRENVRYADGLEWNHVSIAIINSGGIRSSIEKGDIMTSMIFEVSPFGNTVDIVKLSGQVIWDILEFSASSWVESGDENGAFLQMSGLRVMYNMKKKPGNRVVDVKALCADCKIPEFQNLQMTKIYNVLLLSFMLHGGDGYTMIKENMLGDHTIGHVDAQLLLDYITENSPITHGLDGRIQFLQEVGTFCGASETRSFVLLIIIMIVVAVFI